MGKTALVISGGGSKGAFAAGVIKQLSIDYPDIYFDILVGTSTGALIVPLVALDELGLLEELYTSVSDKDIMLKNNVGTILETDNALYNTRPLAMLIHKYYSDQRCERLFSSSKEVYIATTCLQTKKTVYFSSSSRSLISDYEITRALNPDQFRRAVMASACQPVFMPPIEVSLHSSPFRQYVDGGLKEYAGLQLAIDAGAEEIFVILLSAETEESNEAVYGDVMKILERTIDILVTDVGENDLRPPAIYNKALRYIESVKSSMLEDGIAADDIERYFNSPFVNPFEGKKPLKIHLVRPASALGGGPGGLTFNPVVMRSMFKNGETTISHYMASLNEAGDGNV